MIVKQIDPARIAPLIGCPSPSATAGGHEVHPFPELSPGVVGVLQALADPMRLAIVRRLGSDLECRCGGFGLPISKSTLTHHLHVLRAAGVVLQREEGTRRMTSLNREGLERRFPGLLDAVLTAAPEPELPA